MIIESNVRVDTCFLDSGKSKDIDSDYVMTVISGNLAEYVHDGKKKPVILFFWRQGNFILPPASKAPMHSLKALEPTQLGLIKYGNLPNDILEKQRFKNEIYSQSHRAALLTMDSFGRVKWFLKMLYEEHGTAKFEIPMSRMEIALHLGLTFETVSRNFSKLKKQGAVQFDKPNVATVFNLD